ncbi:Bug family tripartite tricarboxylate transporter substrate binding protein [Pigmentiphaga humi]|nr:tripartite tricarboxylate transporter substrate binding protein [Pigmentiphaga humi]
MASTAPRPGMGHPVRILVPQTAGTTNDLLARAIAPGLAALANRPCLVENREGASGMLGMDAVAKSTPDGLTLLNNVSNTLSLPYFYKHLPFDVLADFEPIGIEGYGNHALVVHHSLPVENLRDFIAYANAHPGMEYAAPGLATHHHLCMAMIQAMTGIRLERVLYKGSAGAVADLLSGQIKTMILPMQIAAAHTETLRILGGTRMAPFPLYPDVPSLHQQGLAGFDVEPWFALWAPRGTARQAIDACNALLNEAIGLADASGRLARHGVVPTPGSPDDLKRKAHAEHRLWGEVLGKLRISPE